VLEISNDSTKDRRIEGPSELHTYWKEHRNPMALLYVPKDITATYVEVFDSHFDLDPSFFANICETRSTRVVETQQIRPCCRHL
jgi:hypothetical protein